MRIGGKNWFTDEELNEFSYEMALLYDKRTYFSYYCSLLKTKHDFIYSFFYNNDYNSKIIKIDLFFINFVLNYVINALFFNDDTMHKLYINKGLFDFEYQIPQMIYSSIISFILSTIIKYLALSNNDIIKLKNSNDIEY